MIIKKHETIQIYLKKDDIDKLSESANKVEFKEGEVIKPVLLMIFINQDEKSELKYLEINLAYS